MPGAPPELRRGCLLSDQRRAAGQRGEDLALEHLLSEGYSLVARNHRTRHGEIDLIVRRGGTLVFVEVKLRRGLGFGDPLESVTPHKQQRIRTLAERYLAGCKEDAFEEVRFDVVGVLLEGGKTRITHVEGAF